jgi:DNA-binding response OmpR family regulator
MRGHAAGVLFVVKVLIVEDDVIVGTEVVALAESWGYAASGPHTTSARALSAIETCPPDFAVLDLDLGGGDTSLPVAQALTARAIPFMLLTGHDPSEWRGADAVIAAPLLRKPLSRDSLRGLLEAIAERVPDKAGSRF